MRKKKQEDNGRWEKWWRRQDWKVVNTGKERSGKEIDKYIIG